MTVLTAGRTGAELFDDEQPFRIVRSHQPVLLPQPALTHHVRSLAAEVGALAVILDPALPVGAIGPSLGLPYGVVLHGAEVTVPGRLPPVRPLLARVLAGASLIIAAGGYPMAEAERAAVGRRLPPIVPIPPGVDTQRFVPLGGSLEQAAVRAQWGLRPDAPLVLSISRLVPRKGMDTLIDAALLLRQEHPDVQVAIGGAGRDRHRLDTRVAKTAAPVRLLGPIPDRELPALYGAADVFALCCRERWGGLEQEGFGIVLLEAAATGVPAVVGRSGGAAEAVVDGETGAVVDDPTDPAAFAAAIGRLLADRALGLRQGAAGRSRAKASFEYDKLAVDLAAAIDGMGS
ncbi:MAG TPA: glycosyltransferase family 4 protein [Acidimicrobiales bacterium]|nr:glycosyltransferase family 4 protein [Acidimicrobiales bacterium]